jgi:hypothetical protein
MEIKIKGRDLIDSALNEFWHRNPWFYRAYMGLLGHRISQVGAETLDQDEYIEEWKDKTTPPDPTAPAIITITVFGGCVDKVEGLPEGYDYQVRDLDIQEDPKDFVRLSIPGYECTNCSTIMKEELQCSGCGWVDPQTRRPSSNENL